MTRNELIKAIYDSKEAWSCPDHPCEFMGENGGCMKCAEKQLAEYEAKVRAKAIKDVMKNAEKIQLEQIENLNQSTRRNGKMWAKYMSTYLSHVQVACKRMLLKERKNE